MHEASLCINYTLSLYSNKQSIFKASQDNNQKTKAISLPLSHSNSSNTPRPFSLLYIYHSIFHSHPSHAYKTRDYKQDKVLSSLLHKQAILPPFSIITCKKTRTKIQMTLPFLPQTTWQPHSHTLNIPFCQLSFSLYSLSHLPHRTRNQISISIYHFHHHFHSTYNHKSATFPHFPL